MPSYTLNELQAPGAMARAVDVSFASTADIAADTVAAALVELQHEILMNTAETDLPDMGLIFDNALA